MVKKIAAGSDALKPDGWGTRPSQSLYRWRLRRSQRGDLFLAIGSLEDYEAFVATYGIRRTDPNFWASADWYQDRYVQETPQRAGLFDLNRYSNR